MLYGSLVPLRVQRTNDVTRGGLTAE